MRNVFVLTRDDFAKLLGEAYRHESDRKAWSILEDGPGEGEVVESVIRTAESTPGWLAVPVKSVNLLHSRNGPDRVYVELTEVLAKAIHGDTYPFWNGAHLELRCAADRGEVALEALGLKADETIEY